MNEPDLIVYTCEEVREVLRLHHDLFTDEFRQLPIHEQLDRQAQRIQRTKRVTTVRRASS
jgi:hypothetical protein